MWDRLERALTVVLGLALVLSIVAVGAIAVNPPTTTEPFTEFYLVGPDGNASGYPTELAPGEPGTVIVGISNHEHRAVQYRLEVTWNGSVTAAETVQLADGQTEEQPMTLTAPTEPGRYRLQFHLYNETGTEPYRTTRLLVTVGNRTTS